MATGMSPTAETFDPYHQWLGIPPHEQPPDNYRLLGLPRFESDLAKIAAFADARMSELRKYQAGPRGPFSQKLLNEAASAKLCLLSAQKAAYDAGLRLRLQSRAPLAIPLGPAAYNPVPLPPLAPPQMQPVAPPILRATPAAANDTASAAAAADAPPAAGRPLSRRTIILGASAAVLGVALATWGLGAIWRARRPRTSELGSPSIAPEMETPVDGPEIQPPAAWESRLTQAVPLMQEASGQFHFTPATATLDGGVQWKAGTENTLVHWESGEAVAAWKFRLIKPGFFHAELHYAAPAELGGGRLELELDDQPLKSINVAPTGGAKFAKETYTIALPHGGQHTLLVRVLTPGKGDWLALKSLRLVPVGEKTGK